MERRKFIKRKKNEILSKNELNIYDYYKCKRNLIDIMKNYEEFEDELKEFNLYELSSKGVVSFNTNNNWNSLSPQEKAMSKLETKIKNAEIFYKSLHYLTTKVLNREERLYFRYIYIDKQKTNTAEDDLLITNYNRRVLKQSTVIKACKHFHCLVRKDGGQVIYPDRFK